MTAGRWTTGDYVRVSRIDFGDAIRDAVSRQSNDVGVEKVVYILRKLSNTHETDCPRWLGQRPMDEGPLMRLDLGQTFLDS